MKCSKCSKAEADRTVTMEHGKTKVSIVLCVTCARTLESDMKGENE